MPLTVADALQLDVLRAARLVVAGDDLQSREVRSVSVIEAPVDDFVRPGELVLTTAMGVGQHPDEFIGFVRDIAAFAPAALMIAPGPHVDAIPREVIAVAEACGLPLVELPWELRFSEISQVVLARLLDDQYAALRESLTLQQRLTRLVVNGADLPSLARTLATMLARPVLVTDAAGQVLGRGGGAGFEGRMQLALQRLAAMPRANAPQTVIPELALAISPIQTVREIVGYIGAPVRSEPFSAVEQLMIQHAVTAAALCFLQRRAAEAANVRLRGDFVWGLASGKLASPLEAASHSRLLGYDLERPYVALYGRIAEREAPGTVHGEPRHVILDVLDRAAGPERRAILATVIGETIVAFVEVRRGEDSIEPVVRQIATRLRQHPHDLVATWGVGKTHEGFTGFRQSFQEAQEACEIGLRVHGVGSVTSIAQTGVYRALLRTSAEPESQQFWQEMLQGVLAHDAEKRMDLLGTLETYFAVQGNVSEAARRLCLHRQSLLYRLQRIEELTGGSLADARHRFALELSLHLYQLRAASPLADNERPRDRTRPRNGRVRRRQRARTAENAVS
jgi:purine catabolism regulator